MVAFDSDMRRAIGCWVRFSSTISASPWPSQPGPGPVSSRSPPDAPLAAPSTSTLMIDPGTRPERPVQIYSQILRDTSCQRRSFDPFTRLDSPSETEGIEGESSEVSRRSGGPSSGGSGGVGGPGGTPGEVRRRIPGHRATTTAKIRHQHSRSVPRSGGFRLRGRGSQGFRRGRIRDHRGLVVSISTSSSPTEIVPSAFQPGGDHALFHRVGQAGMTVSAIRITFPESYAILAEMPPSVVARTASITFPHGNRRPFHAAGVGHGRRRRSPAGPARRDSRKPCSVIRVERFAPTSPCSSLLDDHRAVGLLYRREDLSRSNGTEGPGSITSAEIRMPSSRVPPPPVRPRGPS